MMIQSHSSAVDYFSSAEEMLNISIPLTPKPIKRQQMIDG